MPKLLSVTLEMFRGVTGRLTFDLSQDGRPVSVIMFGDNGSGKSTIIDGIEFCLQGGIHGRSIQDPIVPTLRSLYASSIGDCSASVLFETGEVFKRTNRIGERHSYESPAHPSFVFSGFVVRRRDLNDFIDVADRVRPTRVASFLKLGTTNIPLELLPRVQELYEERTKVRNRKRELEDELVAVLSMEPSRAPRSQASLDRLIREIRGIHPDMTKEERRSLPPMPREASTRVHEIHRAYGALRDINAEINRLNSNRFQQALSDELIVISAAVTEAFIRLCPQRQAIRRFTYSSSQDRILKLEVELASGQRTVPTKVLSEASLDLLAILTYIHLIKAANRHGQSQVLILDDVFSSTDASIRQRLAEYIFEEFVTWQIIVCFHDRLWFEQFRRAARARQHAFRSYELGRWLYEVGPQVYEAPTDLSDRLRAALSPGDGPLDRFQISSSAGLLLEALCDHLSINLSIPLPRRLDQRYSLGEMWPGIHARLYGSAARSEVISVDQMLHLRNMVGAHYTEWAQNITLDEAEDFGNRCLALWEKVYCGNCSNYVSRRAARIRCRCGALDISTTTPSTT